MALLFGCRPKPGARIVVKGKLEEIARPADPYGGGLATPEPTALADGETIVWAEPSDGRSTTTFFAANRSASPRVARELGRLPFSDVEARSIHSASKGDGFVVTMIGDGVYRVVLFDDSKGKTAPRVVFGIARELGEPIGPKVRLGIDHVFVLPPPRHSLDTTPLKLLAIPRKPGGAERTIDSKACYSLEVIDDDALFVTPQRNCPGEFPENQRLDLVRIHLADGSRETVYAVQAGSLWIDRAEGSTLFLQERILPASHEPGNPPSYDYRAARLAL